MGTPVKISKRGFESWLKAHPPRYQVGLSNNCINCPLATYLAEQGAEHAAVYTKNYVVDFGVGGRFDKRLSAWAQKFVHRVDQRAGSVTTQRALKIFHEVTH